VPNKKGEGGVYQKGSEVNDHHGQEKGGQFGQQVWEAQALQKVWDAQPTIKPALVSRSALKKERHDSVEGNKGKLRKKGRGSEPVDHGERWNRLPKSCGRNTGRCAGQPQGP